MDANLNRSNLNYLSGKLNHYGLDVLITPGDAETLATLIDIWLTVPADMLNADMNEQVGERWRQEYTNRMIEGVEARRKLFDLTQQIRLLAIEVDCRIEHGAESNGHLEYVHDKLKKILDEG